MSYFRPQQAGKIGPRTIHSFSDSTSRLSQNAGQVNDAPSATKNCLKIGVHSMGLVLLRFLLELGFCFMTGGLRATDQ